MKAVLVIDMPKSCKECLFCGFGGVNLEKYVCCLTGENSEEPHLVGCPLKPLPNKLDANYWHRMFGGEYKVREAKGYGWNACLKEITGETE